MLTTIKHGEITWIKLDSPSAKEVADLSIQFPLHPLVAEELISPTIRPKVDVYKDTLYLILHFPVFDVASQTSVSREIDFVIGKNFLLTANFGQLDPLEEILKQAQSKISFQEKNFKEHAGFLVFTILKELYEFSLRQLDHIHVKVDISEEQIFNGNEEEMVKKISLIKRDILDFCRIVYPHGAVLNSLEECGKKIFGENFTPYLNVLTGDYMKVKNLAEGNKETIEALQQTNESMLSTKTNKIMKTLTILAFITFPLTLLSNIFSMNTRSTPIVGSNADFWIIVGGMMVATLSMLFVFKKKKWL